MKYYFIAGEASGDLHGSHLMAAIKKLDTTFDAHFWGGDLMAAQGGLLVQHYRDTSIMGFVEVLKNIRKINGFFQKAKADILEYKPDVIIFIDYPGFNLRMARWAKEKGFKTVFYITPSVWAWNKSRVYKLRDHVDLCIPILPFEKAFLDKYGVNAIYHGHPLVDIIHDYQTKKGIVHSRSKKCLAIMPGSRVQEVKKILPVLLRAASMVKNDYSVTIAGMKTIPEHLYLDCIKAEGFSTSDIAIQYDKAYDLISNADVAFVKSGTSTLEVALLNVPQVVCYIGNPVSVALAKWLLSIKFISLPNLIMDRAIVKELIQNDCTPENLVNELKYIEQHRSTILSDYRSLKEALGSEGAIPRIAHDIIHFIE